MTDSSFPILRFRSIPDFSIRAGFDGGTLSSDFGALLLSEADQQTGLINRLAQAINDKRHPSYVDHSMHDLLRQRIFQTACGYADGNDSNALRNDPLFKMATGRAPLSTGNELASGPTFSRLEASMTRKDIYRLAKSFVKAFIASYSKQPEIIVLDMDHSEDITHGQQQLSLFNTYYDNYCYLPLFLFEGLSGKLITAVLRPGKRPTGRENTAIIKRVVRLLRKAWPDTRILLRGDAHFANPELMELADSEPNMDFLFGLSGNRALSPKGNLLMQEARDLHHTRCETARLHKEALPAATKLYGDVEYQAGSWEKTYRVVMKAEVTHMGDNPRYIVTSLNDSTPEKLYADLYCQRGQDENFIKAVKNDLASDRTSSHTFLGNHLRLFYSCAAYSLIHAIRENTLAHTELAKAQPMTIIQKLFKIAVRVRQYKDRIKLSLPSSCPIKGLLSRVTELLYLVPLPPAPA